MKLLHFTNCIEFEMYDSLWGFVEIRKEWFLDIENGSNGLVYER